MAGQNEAILHHNIGGFYDGAIDQYHKALKQEREIGGPCEAEILEGIGETTLSDRR